MPPLVCESERCSHDWKRRWKARLSRHARRWQLPPGLASLTWTPAQRHVAAAWASRAGAHTQSLKEMVRQMMQTHSKAQRSMPAWRRKKALTETARAQTAYSLIMA